MESIHDKYAELLVHYCLELKPGERLLIKSSILAEPLVRAIYKVVLDLGAVMETQFTFQEEKRLLFTRGSDFALSYVSPLTRTGFAEYEAFLAIRSPYNMAEDQNIDNERLKKLQESLAPISQTYSERTATRSLKRCLCQYPTNAAAQRANMSLEEYEHFVYSACKLYDDDPIQSWKNVGLKQQGVVDILNESNHIHYLGEHVDLQFSTVGRTWINSDGKTNMPSGEVYTSPVENSVNGHIHFSYPGFYRGHKVEDVTLWFKDGRIEKWEAKQGKDYLDKIFAMQGTRTLGEAAIGTNYDIQQLTNNILFDEKIGGTVHVAIGQSYKQAGGKNISPVHWDMITDMSEQGAIFANGAKIYENGHFLPEIAESF